MKRPHKSLVISECHDVARKRCATNVFETRRGATLTEVLMSLLIMSIGVISVFSLYPIAVLRSIQATQLTNGKILSGNAYSEMLGDSAMVNGAPQWLPQAIYRLGDVITAPVRNGDLLSDSPDKFVCTDAGRSGLTPPDFASVLPAVLTENNTDAVTAGRAVLETTVNNVVWRRATGDYTVSVPVADTTNYAAVRTLESSVNVIDPYGWATHHQNAYDELNDVELPQVKLTRDSYGAAPRFSAGLQMLVDNNDLSDGSRFVSPLGGSNVLSVEDIFRPLFGVVNSDFSAGIDDDFLSRAQLIRVAQDKVRLDGSYESGVGAIVGATLTPLPATGRTLITLPSSPEIAEYLATLLGTVSSLEAASSPQFARVVVRSNSLSATASRWLVSGFDDDGDGAPDVVGIDPAASTVEVAAVTPVELGGASDLTVTFEVFEPRFTWLATVSRDPLTLKFSQANCVVMFRRAFDDAVEVGFSARFGNDPTNVADNGTSLNAKYAWINPRRVIDLDDDGSVDAGEPVVVAEIAVGRQIFDSSTGEWYQIQSIIDAGDPATGALAQVELDREVRTVPAGPDPVLPDALGVSTVPSTVQAVIPRGVVRVFRLNLGS